MADETKYFFYFPFDTQQGPAHNVQRTRSSRVTLSLYKQNHALCFSVTREEEERVLSYRPRSWRASHGRSFLALTIKGTIGGALPSLISFATLNASDANSKPNATSPLTAAAADLSVHCAPSDGTVARLSGKVPSPADRPPPPPSPHYNNNNPKYQWN